MIETAERSEERSRTASFPAEPASARAARHFVVEVLREWKCATVEIVQPAVLMANELVTNAIVHAASAFRLTLRSDGRVVRIEVQDQSPAEPTVTPWSQVTTHGRGMHLVGAMASAWGTDPVPGDGKVVWCELPRRSRC